ncbi:hypothetical protein LguiB_004058 [Lonicera macranthoides]
MKLFVSISGSKFWEPTIFELAYKDPIKVKSVHFIGAKDWLKVPSEELASAFENPLIINHPQCHTVPRLERPQRHGVPPNSTRDRLHFINTVHSPEHSTVQQEIQHQHN